MPSLLARRFLGTQLLGTMVLFALTTASLAKPSPIDKEKPTLAQDSTMVFEPLGALVESDYFHAPRGTFASSRDYPCRMQIRMFDKVQLAQSCN